MKMHAISTAVLLATVFVFSIADDSSVDTTPAHQCSPAESWVADLNAVDIELCPNGERCNLVKGTEKKISLTFTPRGDIDGLHARVHGLIGEFPAPFAVPQPDACQESGLTCPLKAHEQVTYTAALPVKTIYPQISLQVKWELVDDRDNVVACTLIPVKIVKGPKQ